MFKRSFDVVRALTLSWDHHADDTVQLGKSSDKQRWESSTVNMERWQEAAWKMCVGTGRIWEKERQTG